MKKFVVMMGLPRSGKSTYVDSHLSDYQVICADDIRLAMGVQYLQEIESFVWANHDVMIKAYLIRGKNIVVDATNTTDKTLKKYKKLANEYNYKFEVIFIDTNYKICFDRNIGKDAVPDAVIDRMMEQIEVLAASEFWKKLNVKVIKC